MNKEMVKELPQWEESYLAMENNTLTDREKEILKGSDLRSHEGMMYGRMYADWKRQRGFEFP